MWQQRLGSWLLCASTLAAVACGGDDDSPAVSTGLPASQKLSALKESEAKQVCESYGIALHKRIPDSELKRVGCTWSAAIAVGFQAGSFDVAKCNMLVDRCVASADGSVDGGGTVRTVSTDDMCDDTQWVSLAAGCEATIGDYEACASAQLDLYAASLAAVMCKEPTTGSSEQDIASEEPPAGCKPLVDKCAALFSDKS